MPKKLLFIYNPTSGKSRINPLVGDVIDIFVKGGYTVTVRPTQQPFDARDVVAAHACDFDTVAVSGGDGTLSEVVQGLMLLPKEKRPPIGYIPSGTTNDFAASLGLSSDVLTAAHDIVNGTPYECDCGLFNGTPYLYVAAFGIFTDVSYETPQKTKNIFGHTAYVLEGIKRLNTYRHYSLKLESEEKTVEGDFILGFVANTSSIGGIKRRSEYVPLLNDGLFECIFVKNPTSAVDIQTLLTGVLKMNIESDGFVVFKTNSLRITCDEPMSWTTDGEDGGSPTQVEISVVPRAYSLLMPKESASPMLGAVSQD